MEHLGADIICLQGIVAPLWTILGEAERSAIHRNQDYSRSDGQVDGVYEQV